MGKDTKKTSIESLWLCMENIYPTLRNAKITHFKNSLKTPKFLVNVLTFNT